ncbi:hypothetical protein KSF73_02705 [Burkholderiaceae bacterium DAT-1]|nr:hypothetical protein [Burkholderiaceae bacterium DAT-1]
MFAALWGGLSQIAAVLAYARVGRITHITGSQAMLSKQLVAELVKVIVSLLLAASGFAVLFALNLAATGIWLLISIIAAQIAYGVVLFSK